MCKIYTMGDVNVSMLKEKIILAPGCKGTELRRSLASHGINCMNLRIVGAYELARTALMRSGITVRENFVSAQEENAIISRIANQTGYFAQIRYADVSAIASILRTARSLVVADDEASELKKILSDRIFTDKNRALLEIYEKYISELKKNNKIDVVLFIKRAISEVKPVEADFVTLREYPLNPMEKALVTKLSDNRYTESSIADLICTDTKQHDLSTQIKIDDYYKCYGAPNEVENILSIVYRTGKLDKCIVAVTNPAAYAQLFFDYSLLYNIPVTFGTGIPISNSNPGKLLKLYYHWATDGMFSAASVTQMIESSVFNRAEMYRRLPDGEDMDRRTFIAVLKALKLTNHREKNLQITADFEKAIEEELASFGTDHTKEYDDLLKKKKVIPAVKYFAEELSAPCETFIGTYVRMRIGSETFADDLLRRLDKASNAKICNELSAVRASGMAQTDEDIIQNILHSMVCAETSRPGSLHIATIKSAFSTIRDTLFVAGLSSAIFPGNPKEHYLLLDDDLDAFGPDARILSSEERMSIKNELLKNLIELVSGLNGHIYVSYPALDVSELKRDNVSSSVFEIYKMEAGENVLFTDFEKRLKTVAYFEPDISSGRMIGRSYLDDVPIYRESFTPVTGKFSANLEKAYSPSALEAFFGCEVSFMLNSVLGIPEPEEDKPFEVISSADMGTLAHTMMEKLGNDRDMELPVFLNLCESSFDRYILEHTPLIQESVKAKKTEFLTMMENAYRSDPHREVILKEEDIECEHECGIKIHGYPDRVEKLPDGSYCVVDFKTGRNIEHMEDDINTCLQVIIYAYILEKTKGLNISRCEFRYIRLGQTVGCVYDDAVRDALYDKLSYFKTCMENGTFRIPYEALEGSGDVCRYCKYSEICGKYPDWEVKINDD